MSFASVINRFVNKTVKDMNTVKRKAAVTMATRIIIATPVDKGVLRNNWYFGINAPHTGSTSEANADAFAVVERAEQDIAPSKMDDVLFLTNNLPYAETIEYDGHSAQAPRGMVRLNILSWDEIVEFHATEVLGGV